MHKIKLLYLFLGLGLLFSCSKESGEDIASQQSTIEKYLSKVAYTKVNDIYKVVAVPGYGYEPEIGDTVTFNYTIFEYTSKNVIISNVPDTLTRNGFDLSLYPSGPTKVVIGEENFLSGMQRGLRSIHAGEVCDIYLTSNLGYGDKPSGPVVGNTILRVRMQIVTINSTNIISERQKLADYIASESITAKPQDQGYYFIETAAGVDPKAKVGDTTYVSYVCKTLDGTVVEEVPESSGYCFIVGSGNAPVVGLDLAVRLMAKGASAKVVLPSYLAYGKVGKGVVKPYESVVFDVKLVDIKTKN